MSLVPFIGKVPWSDGWRKTFQYKSDGDTYTLCVAMAANVLADQPWTTGFTSYFDEDIVIMDGYVPADSGGCPELTLRRLAGSPAERRSVSTPPLTTSEQRRLRIVEHP